VFGLSTTDRAASQQCFPNHRGFQDKVSTVLHRGMDGILFVSISPKIVRLRDGTFQRTTRYGLGQYPQEAKLIDRTRCVSSGL
jgi:hypothetical protein